jgi:hypothetical protein
MKTDISLNDCIDKYCAEHARDNNPNVAAVWNALKSAVDTNDQHKASLNHKIWQELMRDYTSVMLRKADEQRTKLGVLYETSS